MDQLIYKGITYPLAGWMTQTAYAEKYGMNIKTLGGQISRGVINPENLLDVPEWGLRLLRDVPPPVVARGPRPKLKNPLSPRHRVLPGPNGTWHLLDTAKNEIVTSVNADDEAEATELFNLDGYEVDGTGAVTGVFL